MAHSGRRVATPPTTSNRRKSKGSTFPSSTMSDQDSPRATHQSSRRSPGSSSKDRRSSRQKAPQLVQDSRYSEESHKPDSATFSSSENDSESSDDDDGLSSPHPTTAGMATAASEGRSREYNFATTQDGRHQVAITRTDRNTSTPESATTTQPMPPNAMWRALNKSQDQVKVEKTAVNDFVSNYLFPRLKFIRGAMVNLDYSEDTKSICGLVMKGCHQQPSPEGRLWWAMGKKQTINDIKRLRNDASKNMKHEFLGKFIKPHKSKLSTWTVQTNHYLFLKHMLQIVYRMGQAPTQLKSYVWNELTIAFKHSTNNLSNTFLAKVGSNQESYRLKTAIVKCALSAMRHLRFWY